MKKHKSKVKKVARSAKAKKKANKSTNKTIRAPHAGPLAPLNDRVVVKPLSPEEMGTTTAMGIIIPDSSKEKPEQGTVVAVGPGKYENGERIPISVAVGDRVMFSKYGYDEIKIDGTLYYVIAESNVLAILNK